MAKLLSLPTFNDNKGALTVIEKVLPFEIKRVYYIYHAKGQRGGHRHKKTLQALVSICGSCEVYTDNGQDQSTFILDAPDKILLLDCRDWHTMSHFTPDNVLLVLASEFYDRDDYIDERY